MTEHFSLHLTDEEQTFLHDAAREAIRRGLASGVRPELENVPPENSVLREPFGAFVTLKIDGRLRGCIGNIVGMKPLYRTVADMAFAAAFEDCRFPPLTPEEAARMTVEISVMSPLVRCPNPEAIEIGRHGLLLRKNGRQGVFLPQVPVEWNWDRQTYLDQLCRKAGLPFGAWKAPDAELYWFEAVVF